MTRRVVDDSAKIQFMFEGYGSPLFPRGRLRRAGMTPQWTFHTVCLIGIERKILDTLSEISRYVDMFDKVNQKGVRHLPVVVHFEYSE
jgi:hypothetical protein